MRRRSAAAIGIVILLGASACTSSSREGGINLRRSVARPTRGDGRIAWFPLGNRPVARIGTAPSVAAAGDD